MSYYPLGRVQILSMPTFSGGEGDEFPPRRPTAPPIDEIAGSGC